MLGKVGPTQRLSGAAESSPGRGALALLQCYPHASELTQPQALAAPGASSLFASPHGDSGSPQGCDHSGGSGAAADTHILKPLGE